MTPSTVTRVPENTAPYVNRWIREQTEANVARLAGGDRKSIDRRLAQLDREWDIERFLELNAPIAGAVGLVLAATVNRRWILFTGAVLGLLALHAIEGWCPPVPVLRRLGFRTSREIADERYALKAFRGDFDGISREAGQREKDAGQILAAVRR